MISAPSSLLTHRQIEQSFIKWQTSILMVYLLFLFLLFLYCDAQEIKRHLIR